MAKSKIKCVFLQPSNQMQLSLRRYQGVPEGQTMCPATNSYHNAEVIIIPRMPRDPEHPDGCGLSEHEDYPRTDPRWPTACACGHVFGDQGHWQISKTLLFSSPDLPDLTTLKDAPVGAMWYADWYDQRGPDGHCLVVKTPGGDWIVDYPCKDGKGWDRTGTPPNVTAKPSIGIGLNDKGQRWKYHGWLRNGYLEEC